MRGLAVIVAAVAAGGTHVATGGAAAVACDVATLQARAPAGTTITSARVVEAPGRPRHCQVEGHVASEGNTVTFRLGLPDTWNDKFVFLGVGGLGGNLPAVEPGIARGYATASTDTGHVSSDPTWASNRAKEIDYGYRGTHVTTVASKALTASFYGKPPQYAYFNGCSNGGRQALMEVQRYPDDFDGVIGGHPATGTPMQVGRAVVYQQMLASKDNYLSADAIELLSRATLAACDKADGLEDGLVSDPRACRFDPASLTCASPGATGCLTPGQVATVKQIHAGVKAPDGKTFAHGFPPGHEGGPTGWIQWISGQAPPVPQADGSLAYAGRALPSGYGLMDFNFKFLSLETDDPAYDWRAFNLARDLPRMKTMIDILSPLDTDLAPFRASGGKLLLYHGWSDPGISALGTLDYYEQVVRAAGGQGEADRFVRAYFIPGMHHCGGGPGPNQFDMLPVLEDWVERGVAPGAIVASQVVDGRVTRTRPICPHPKVARYNGKGSPDDAASFSCQ
ncbi:MAG: tannase/feruloyl esterase family alpha/beta hydrolase [Vicinamibacterales bacterium]